MDSDTIVIYPKVFLIFLNLTHLSPDKKNIKFDTLEPTLFIIIFHSNNKLICIMMASLLSLFYFQDLDKLDFEVLDFLLSTELSILEWFSTWFFKHARIPVRTYFQGPITL